MFFALYIDYVFSYETCYDTMRLDIAFCGVGHYHQEFCWVTGCVSAFKTRHLFDMIMDMDYNGMIFSLCQ